MNAGKNTSKIWGKTTAIPPLKSEGFIHCSEKHQLLESAQKHFAEESELVVLCIVEKRVRNILKREPSRNGELFPHVYGSIPPDAIETTEYLAKNDEGLFDLVDWK